MTTPQVLLTSTAFSARAAEAEARSVGIDPPELCAYETRTGIVRRWLPLADWPDWERGLNLAGSWQASVPLDSRYISKEELTAFSTPYYFSWAVVQGNKIWQAGPVTGEDYAGGGATRTTISGVGMLGFLTAKRLMLNPARATRRGAAAIDADIVFSPNPTSPIQSPVPAANQNLALPSIAARIVEIVLAEPGGDLPIDIASTTIPGTAERTYPGYDLGYVGERLTELTQAENGPEIEFDPYFTTPDRTLVRHRMLVGNRRLGALATTSAVRWDSDKALVDLAFGKDGTVQLHRAYQRGSGMDRNTLIGFAENLAGVTSGPNQVMPLLEDVNSSHTQVELLSTLDGYARADVATDVAPALTLRPTVRIAGDDGKGRNTRSPNLAQVSSGDVAVLEVLDHPRLADGSYTVRVIRFKSARSAVEAAMDVQVLDFTARGTQ
jgi:hypothetical protein